MKIKINILKDFETGWSYKRKISKSIFVKFEALPEKKDKIIIKDKQYYISDRYFFDNGVIEIDVFYNKDFEK